MNPGKFISLAIAAVLRTLAVLLALFGVYIVVAPIVMTGFGVSLTVLRVPLVHFISAVVLWMLSKPISTFVMRSLDE